MLSFEDFKPGDVLDLGTLEVDGRSLVSAGFDDLGLRYEMVNQRDEIPMSLVSIVFYRRRPRRAEAVA